MTNDHWSIIIKRYIKIDVPLKKGGNHMPTENFYKLESAKRQKIIDAMKKEFSRVPFHEASINRIVEEAGISKGSFWVYFKSKEEAIEYLIEAHLEKERKKSKEIFLRNKGDLFQSYLEIYDYLAKSKINKMEKALRANIFKNLITNEEKCLHQTPEDNIIETVKNVVNTSNLDILDDNDLIDLMKILNYMMRMNLLDVISKKVTPEHAKARFVREIEILKKGVSKEKEGRK